MDNMVKDNLIKIKEQLIKESNLVRNKISKKMNICVFLSSLIYFIFRSLGSVGIIVNGIKTSDISLMIYTVLGVSIDVYMVNIFIKKIKTMRETKKLCSHIEKILEVSNPLDSHLYESYVITDCLKDENYSLKTIKELNDYLSNFDKDQPNKCNNEIGLRYNYSPVSDSKLISKSNDLIEVITDNTLVGKYLQESTSPNILNPNLQYIDNSNFDVNNGSCTNFVGLTSTHIE